jgi:hypothetical protein
VFDRISSEEGRFMRFLTISSVPRQCSYNLSSLNVISANFDHLAQKQIHASEAGGRDFEGLEGLRLNFLSLYEGGFNCQITFLIDVPFNVA